MREVLEEIITHPAGIDPETLSAIHSYTKLFWINTGPFNNLTARKFLVETTPAAFGAAVAAAARAGAMFPTHDGETLTRMVERMMSLFFDQKVGVYSLTYSTLALLAVTIRILTSFDNRLLGNAEHA